MTTVTLKTDESKYFLMISFLHDDLASLYKLVERLLDSDPDGETQVIAGKLPETFPSEILFPPNTNIVGSVVYRDRWHDRTQVFLDVGLEQQQVDNFYQNNLSANWTRSEHQGVIFTRFADLASKTSEDMCFVNLAQNIELNIDIEKTPPHYSQVPSATKVLLDIWKRSNLKLSYVPLLILPAPSDVDMLSWSASNGEKESNAEAKLTTNLNLQELIIHFATYFEQKRWVEDDCGQKENSIWRSYEMTDENAITWLGVLQLTSLSEAKHYFVSARISQE